MQTKYIALLFALALPACTVAPTPKSVERSAASSPLVILQVGDSQTAGYFGAEMYQYFSNFTEVKYVHVVGIGASSPHHWIGAKDTEDYNWLCSQKGRYNQNTNIDLSSHLCARGSSALENAVANTHPNWIVFQFLGNSIGHSKEAITMQVHKMLKSAHSATKCIFITSPPNYKTFQTNNLKRLETQEHFVQAVDKKCQLIKGITPHTMENFSSVQSNYLEDNVHLSATGAHNFSKYVQTQIK